MKIHKWIIVALLAMLLPFVAHASVRITDMRINGLVNPCGTDPDGKAVFSWVLSSDKPETMQTAYRIVVYSQNKKLWDTGKVMSDRSIDVTYDSNLLPDTEYSWTLQVWDNHGSAS